MEIVFCSTALLLDWLYTIEPLTWTTLLNVYKQINAKRKIRKEILKFTLKNEIHKNGNSFRQLSFETNMYI